MKPLFLPGLLLVALAHGAPAASAPATLSKEGDLMTIVLRPEAEQRLRLVTVPVEKRAVPAVRLFAGEVVTSLAARDGQTAPVLGGTLEETLRAADLQLAADGRVAEARVQVAAAKLTLARAEKIYRSEAGSERAVDDARAALATAEAALRTAESRRELLGTPGDRGRTRVRVPVYSGEAALLDPAAAAQLKPVTLAGPGVAATPVAGPRTANAAAATVDWYYELPAGSTARPGERVAVEIPVRDSRQEHLVVPFRAVLHDYHGGQWVYLAIAPHTYARHRVEVARLAGDDAVLARGPAPGTKVVTDGAAELFGTEFMTGK